MDTWLGLFDIFMLEFQGRLGFNFKFKTLGEELPYKKDGGVRPQNQNLFGPILSYGRPSIPQVRTTLAEFGSLFFLPTRHLNCFFL